MDTAKYTQEHTVTTAQIKVISAAHNCTPITSYLQLQFITTTCSSCNMLFLVLFYCCPMQPTILLIINSSTSSPTIFSEERTLGLEWESNPQSHMSGVMP